MNKTLKARFQQRAYTAAKWQSDNPVLMEREIGFITDTGQYKIGDGKTAWNDLQAHGSNSTAFKGATISTAGEAGLVPAPNAGEQEKFLSADGTWKKIDTTVYVSTSKADNPLVWLEISGGVISQVGNNPYISITKADNALIWLHIK